MTSNSSIFSYKTRHVIVPVVHTADNSIIHVQNIRTINTLKLSISDIFHVLKVSLNLLSVDQLCELGVDVHFLSLGYFVQNPQRGEILRTGHRVGRQFELESLRILFKIVVISSIWHACLGHFSDSRLRPLISNGCLGHVKIEHFDCVLC